MGTSDLQRHQTIKDLTARHADKVADTATCLWDQLAAQLISIIGEGGFESLYARSVFLTQSTFPWLAAGSGSPRTGHRFAELKISFEGQTPALASEANIVLLITFTDILSSLVGEQLTSRILHSAWGDGAQNKAGKELK
jgi:hypothetical protein